MEKGMEYFRHDDTKIRYDGLFKNNLYHGKGKLYNENGICWTGVFKNGMIRRILSKYRKPPKKKSEVMD